MVQIKQYIYRLYYINFSINHNSLLGWEYIYYSVLVTYNKSWGSLKWYLIKKKFVSKEKKVSQSIQKKNDKKNYKNGI